MKKKNFIPILIAVLVAVAIFGGLIIFSVVKNLKKQSDTASILDLASGVTTGKSTSKYEIESISEGYAWAVDGVEYNLVEIDTGKIVLTLPKIYEAKPVHSGYFIVRSNNLTNKFERKLMDTKGNVVIEYPDNDYQSETLERGGILVDKSDYGYFWAVRTLQKLKDINGTTSIMKYYAITDDGLVDCTTKVNNNGYYFDDVEDKTRLDFEISSYKKNDSIYILENNGFFTIMKNGKECFTPISGKVEAADSCEDNYRLVALIDGKHYIVDDSGARQEITCIDATKQVRLLYQGIIVLKDHTIMNINTGKQIQIK